MRTLISVDGQRVLFEALPSCLVLISVHRVSAFHIPLIHSFSRLCLTFIAAFEQPGEDYEQPGEDYEQPGEDYEQPGED